MSWGWPRNSLEVPGPEAGLVGQLGRVGQRVRPAAPGPVGSPSAPAPTSDRSGGADSTSRRPFTAPPPAPAGPGGATPRPRPRLAALEGPPDLVGAVPELDQRGPHLAAGLGRARAGPPGTPSPAKSGSSRRERRSRTSRAAVLRPTPGTAHSAPRSSSSTARTRSAGPQGAQHGEGQGGPDAVGAEQGLEAPSLLGGGEAVEHDGVLADVGVHVQRPPRRPDRPPRRAARATRSRGSPTPPHVDDELALGRCGPTSSPRSQPITAGLPAPAASMARRRGCAVRWQTARARASATSGGLGGSARPSRAATIVCTWSLVAPPKPTTACLTSLALYCATSHPASAATSRATPPAWPVAMAVRTLVWKNTRSTTTASGRDLGHQGPQLGEQHAQALRERERRARSSPPRRPWPSGRSRTAAPARSRSGTGRGRCPGRTRVRL